MDESLSVPNIFAEIARPSYSERNLLKNLHDLQLLDEDMYIESFMQFILDCAELPLHITIDMNYPEAINRCTLNDMGPERFLIYREPSRAASVTGFLQAFLSSNDESTWTEKFTSNIAELLNAMLDMEAHPRITSCGLFFLVGILFECTCIRTNYRMSPESPILANFCTKLLGMYDYDLLTDDNYLDIGLKLNYLFLFNADMFLNGDVENVKHLTALLLIDNNQLKGELLQTLDSVLDSATTPYAVKQGIISELVILRDVLISFCHFGPSGVALSSLKMLKSHSQELLSEVEAKDKVYLLMGNANKKVRDSAKLFFFESYKDYMPRNEVQNEDNDQLLEVLDKFVGKYEEAVNKLPEILHLILEDHQLNLMELYLYIVKSKSNIASRISAILVNLMIKNLDTSVEASDRLIDFVKICRGLLQTLSLVSDKSLYLELIQNITRLPDSILSHIPMEDANDIRENFLSRLMDPEFKYREQLWIARVLVNVIRVKGVPGDLIEMLRFRMDDWEGLGACLEATLSSLGELSMPFEALNIKDLNGIATEELANDRDDKIYIIHVKQMCVLILTEKGLLAGREVISEVVSILRVIDQEFICKDHAITDRATFGIILKSMINLTVASVTYYKESQPDQLNYLKNITSPLDLWTERFPDSMDSYKLLLDWIEFIPHAMSLDLSKLWVLLLKTPNHRSLFPELINSCFRNRFADSQTKLNFFIETTAKTIHNLIAAEPPTFWVTGAAQALQKFFPTEISNNPDLIDHGPSITTNVVIRVLGQFETHLSQSSGPTKRTDNRLKALDIFLDNGGLLKNVLVTPADQTNISKSILKVMKLSPTDVEVKTLRKIVALWK